MTASRAFARRITTCALCLSFVVTSGGARALDKQGAAHGGKAEGGATVDETDHPNLSGGLLFGMALYNPTYAARPDNTGLALFRYALHLDIDLIGRKLSFPLDLNVFTDRTRKGPEVLVPTEGDIIFGVTSTWDAGPGSLEMGVRMEHDRPLDRAGFSQTYVDTRSRYVFSMAKAFPALRDALADGDVSGFLTLGTFLYNPTYASRPDNSGLALFRYGAHAELSVWHDHVSFGVDTTYFTDRATSHFRPSELDLTTEIIGRVSPFELHLAYERDMPLWKSGLVQDFLYMVWAYTFDLRRKSTAPLEERNSIVSP